MMSSEILPWVLFNLFILLMLAIDLFIFHRKARSVSIKEASLLSVFWIALSLLFNLYIYYSRGSEAAINFLTGYLIEKSLSVDNLFVFLLIFNYFKTPSSSLHKVLFFGVLGAIVMRALFILLGIALITSFHWIIYLFGLFLIYTGIKFGFEKDKEVNPEHNLVLKVFRRFFNVTNHYEDGKFFVLRHSRYVATPLLIVLISIETTDLIFAIDSVPAVLAITFDPFIVYTSNIFAILGLRSLYFVLAHMLGLFHYIYYAVSFILVFVGLKMLLTDVFPLSNFITLGVVFLALMVSILASIFFPKQKIL